FMAIQRRITPIPARAARRTKKKPRDQGPHSSNHQHPPRGCGFWSLVTMLEITAILNAAEICAEARIRFAAHTPLSPKSRDDALALLDELERTNDAELRASLVSGLKAYLS